MLSRWSNYTNRRTGCRRKMSTYEPGWRLVGPSNRGNLPANFLLPTPAKAKRLLRRTTSTCRQMTSFPPVVPCSRVVLHPLMPRKPNLEKGYLADQAGSSMSQGAGCGENPAGTNDRQRQLINMCLTGLGASPRQYHLYTRPSGSPPLRK